MVRFILLGCLTAFFAASPGFPQQEDAPAPETETATPSAPAAEEIPAPAVCLVGEYSAFPQAEARTAALLVCDEFGKLGLSVEPVFHAPDSESVYRLDLYRLGQKVLARLSQEYPVGTVIAERQLQLGGIEEMISAAPRLVEALVHGKSVSSTADMESVVDQEGRQKRKIPGEFLWDVGIVGSSAPMTDSDMIARPGYRLEWYFESPTYALDMGYWGVKATDSEKDSFEYRYLGIGGRYFLNKNNFSPYVGAGLGRVWANYRNRETEALDRGDVYEESLKEKKDGLGVYALGGIEALRLTRVRFRLEFRVDRPLFQLPSRDMMPLTLGVSFSLPGPWSPLDLIFGMIELFM